jgi:hypothetical protein
MWNDARASGLAHLTTATKTMKRNIGLPYRLEKAEAEMREFE